MFVEAKWACRLVKNDFRNWDGQAKKRILGKDLALAGTSFTKGEKQLQLT